MTQLGGAVLEPALAALLDEEDTLRRLTQDTKPLPSSDSRSGQYEDRHLEFWLSGLLDCSRIVEALDLQGSISVLDLEGWSGRVTRHLAQVLPEARFYVGERTTSSARLMRSCLGDRTTPFVTPSEPRLPFADASLDAVLALSFFPFIEDEASWLLELRRVLKPDGLIYATVYDDATWSDLPKWYAGKRLLADADFRAYYQTHPVLSATVTSFDPSTGNCTVFRSKAYLEAVWSRVFFIEKIITGAHGEQAAVVLGNESHVPRSQAKSA